MKESMPGSGEVSEVVKNHMTAENIESSYKRSISYDKGFKQGMEKGYIGEAILGKNKPKDAFEAGFEAGVKKGIEMAKNE